MYLQLEDQGFTEATLDSSMPMSLGVTGKDFYILFAAAANLVLVSEEEILEAAKTLIPG